MRLLWEKMEEEPDVDPMSEGYKYLCKGPSLMTLGQEIPMKQMMVVIGPSLPLEMAHALICASSKQQEYKFRLSRNAFSPWFQGGGYSFAVSHDIRERVDYA